MKTTFFVFYRKRAALDAHLLQQHDGIVELGDLIRTQDVRNCEFASEVICLASEIDATLIWILFKVGVTDSLLMMKQSCLTSSCHK
jgi:hypothetical protein